MADFQISILNNGVESVLPDENYIVVNDYSNYFTSDEDGAEQADFTEFYKVIAVSQLGTYTFSSVGDGDADIATPSEASSSPISISIPTMGDAKYLITIIAIPTWDSAASYILDDHIYYNGVIYKALQPSNDDDPETETAYWEVVAEADVSDKYRVDYEFVNTFTIEKEFADNTKLAVGDQLNGIGKDFTNNPYWEKAAKLDNLLSAIDVYSVTEDWDTCDHLIAHSKIVING